MRCLYWMVAMSPVLFSIINNHYSFSRGSQLPVCFLSNSVKQQGLFDSTTGNSSPPLNPSVSTTQNQPSSSIITLEWDTPSSTGGVSVSYVLTISPTPISGSPVTTETNSVQITVSYNTPYNVTIRAVNCAGSSSDVILMISSIG